jgi:hypothetical protein
VLWFRVPVSLALLHQAVGLATFLSLLVANHRLLYDGCPAAHVPRRAGRGGATT